MSLPNSSRRFQKEVVDRMIDNLEQYIVMATISAAVAIFVGTRIFLVFRK